MAPRPISTHGEMGLLRPLIIRGACRTAAVTAARASSLPARNANPLDRARSVCSTRKTATMIENGDIATTIAGARSWLRTDHIGHDFTDQSRKCHARWVDFSRVELSADDQAFRDELRALLQTIVTEDVIRRDRETGENFDEGVHLALGDAGYLAAEFNDEADGGFSRLRRRLWNLELGRAHTPWFHWGTTAMVARAVRQFGSPELKEEVMERALSGQIRLCLGYTEPEGGSDVATCKTRAVRDGDGWIINGSKMFTSNAQNAAYVFLITNTDPSAPKHQSLTMFLVPLDSPGVEIQPIRTVDGDRTNITYYSDVRVDDRYRLGEVNGGWTVLRDALNDEHGTVERGADGLQKVAAMAEHLVLLAEAIDKVAALAADDDAVKYRLGRGIARMEAAMSTPDMFGRVANAQTMRDVSLELMDIQGAVSTLPVDAHGAVADGGAEYVFRLAGPTGIYGGTLEVFRNMIAQHALGLGRAAYSPPAKQPPRAGDHLGGEQVECLVGSAVVGEQHDLAEAESCSSCRRSTIAGGVPIRPPSCSPKAGMPKRFSASCRTSAATRRPARAPSPPRWTARSSTDRGRCRHRSTAAPTSCARARPAHTSARSTHRHSARPAAACTSRRRRPRRSAAAAAGPAPA